MRISDWSSDVCSSDLGPGPPAIREIAAPALSRREKRHEIGSIARTKVGGEMTAPCYYIHERRKQAASIRRVGRYLMAEMIDPFGRAITYLRVSVTDRCDFRCVYCMAEDMSFLPKKEILSLEELDRVCSAFVRRGVKKLRLTGGEPLVRRDIMKLFHSLSRHLDSGALEELTLTTNGSQLSRFAHELAGLGVRSEEHTSELQSLMRISSAVFCLKKKIFHFYYSFP